MKSSNGLIVGSWSVTLLCTSTSTDPVLDCSQSHGGMNMIAAETMTNAVQFFCLGSREALRFAHSGEQRSEGWYTLHVTKITIPPASPAEAMGSIQGNTRNIYIKKLQIV